MPVGVLALQGDWDAHLRVLAELGLDSVAVRTAAQLDSVEALVLPGGESTAMLRLMEPEALDQRLGLRIDAGMPVLATCAGVVLLARGVEPDQPSLQRLDVDVIRNGFGRQVHSDTADIQLAAELATAGPMTGVFIRAPRIVRVGDGVEVLGTRDNEPVIVRQGLLLAATFHPELTADRRLHAALVAMLEAAHA
jgi:5'-phosphate synthase pdxT subunit